MLVKQSLFLTLKVLFFLVTTSLTINGQSVKTTISVSKRIDGEKVIYVYAVKNNWTAPIWMVDIGCEPDSDPVLDVEPIQVDSPTSWEGFFRWLEETFPKRYCVTWKQPKTISLANELVQPGETKTGFIVVLNKESIVFENCIFTVYFSKKGGQYSGKVSNP